MNAKYADQTDQTSNLYQYIVIKKKSDNIYRTNSYNEVINSITDIFFYCAAHFLCFKMAVNMLTPKKWLYFLLVFLPGHFSVTFPPFFFLCYFYFLFLFFMYKINI